MTFGQLVQRGGPVVLHDVGGAGDAVVERLAAAFHQAVGVEQQGRPRGIVSARFGAVLAGTQPERRRTRAVEQPRGAVRQHQDRRRVAGARSTPAHRCPG